MLTEECASDEELVAAVDEPDAARHVAAHVATCTVCQERVATLRDLFSDLRVPVQNFEAEEFVDALRERVEQPGPARPWRWRAVVMASGAVAAAASMLLFPEWTSQEDLGTFTARGVQREAGARREVGLRLFRVGRAAGDSGRIVPIDRPTAVNRSDHLLLAYETTAARSAHRLLCFGVDSMGDVHWLYPAYEDASTDPEAISLPPGVASAPMNTEAVLDDVPLGVLRVFAVVTEDVTVVSRVETMADGGIDATKLSAVFPQADIRMWSLEVAAEGESR